MACQMLATPYHGDTVLQLLLSKLRQHLTRITLICIGCERDGHLGLAIGATGVNSDEGNACNAALQHKFEYCI